MNTIGVYTPGDTLPPGESLRRLRRYVPRVVVESLLHDQARLHGERREVTVLFADAVNFTHLSASLDAESVFELINDMLGRLMACVHRYNGVVDKFTGDGLMAIFGAPIAHENDVEMAVRAALDMQKATAEFSSIAQTKLGAPLQLRIGIHSGPAIAGILGTQEQAAYTVIGETVNLAARLESLAQPGHIWTSDGVYQRVQALFDFQPVGTLPIKGIDAPLAVYAVLGDRAKPLSIRGLAGTQPIFLGHGVQLTQLQTLLQAFQRDQHGRLAIIRGEAGIGKTRLVSEWLAGIPEGHFTVLHGRGLPYAQGVDYGVFRSLLQSALRADPPRDCPGSAKEPTLWDVISAPLRPYLRRIAGLKMTEDERKALQHLDPEQIKQLTTLALREWLLQEAQKKDLVLILDDFHWADDLSRDTLSSLIPIIHQAPVLFCVMTRPQPETPFNVKILPTGEDLAAPLSLTLEVPPLSTEDSRALLGHLINLDNLPEALIKTILARAEGNPFYIEEFVRMLIEKDLVKPSKGQWAVASTGILQTMHIPTNLRGLMMARVDRLPEELRRLLRDAAVIGLQFPTSLLAEIEKRQYGGDPNLIPSLERLTDMGLLVARPEAGEQVYAFRHILTQESLYRSILRSQRPVLHHTVAEAVEHCYAEDISRHIEVLALHYDHAGAREKALHYTVLAGDRARERFANREALEYYSRALQLTQRFSEQAATGQHINLGLGDVNQHIGNYEEAIACYRAALDDQEQISPKIQAEIMLNLGQVWNKHGNLEESEVWLRQGLVQLSNDKAANPNLYAQLYAELGWLDTRRGNLTTAQQWLERGLTLVDHTGHYKVLSSILNRLGAVHYHRSAWKEAATCVERSLTLRKQMGDLVGYARSLNNLSILQKSAGDWDEALTNYERAAEIQERLGDVEGLSLTTLNLGILYTERGEWPKAQSNLQRSLEIAQQINHPYRLGSAHLNLGRFHLLQDREVECARHLNAAINLYTEAGARAHPNLSDAYGMSANLCLKQNNLEEAQAWIKRSYELLVEATGSTEGNTEGWGRYEQLRGRLALARDRLEEAQNHLQRSREIFQNNGLLIEIGHTAYWQAVLWRKLRQTAPARETLAKAQEIFQKLGAAPALDRVRQEAGRLPQ